MLFYEEVLSAFNKAKIHYILAGGVAFNLLGGDRATFDLDILVDMTADNLRKSIKTLLGLGYKVRQPVNPLDFANKQTRQSWITEKGLKDFNFYKSEKSLEQVAILIDCPGY